ncbi:MAG: ribosome silencing factor [Pyrinomonadaceae bacterium]
MEEVKTKALKRESVSETVTITGLKPTPFEELDDEARIAIHCASEKKAENIVALDLREITSFAEFFVIASGRNQRQVQAIADEINLKLKKQHKTKAIRIEGYDSAEWVLLDYGDFIFHIFNETSREFYDLERLWRDARRVQLPEDL